jgi:hypothetical protein
VLNQRESILGAAIGVLLVLVPLALEVGGCHGGQWSELGSNGKSDKQSKQNKVDGLQIVAKSNREVARLNADDVVRIMQRVGFSDDQIVELGTDLHNALLLSGGAEVYYNKHLEMIFAINNQQVQIQSRSRGTFIYDVSTRRFVLGSPPADKSR